MGGRGGGEGGSRAKPGNQLVTYIMQESDSICLIATGSVAIPVVSINPLRLQYVILRTKSQNRCDYCTYTYFAIEIWGFYRRLTDTLRYHHTRCSRASGLQLAAILQHVYQRKKSGVYSELSAVFGEFWKITIVGPSSIHRLAWNTMANYMDFLP